MAQQLLPLVRLHTTKAEELSAQVDALLDQAEAGDIEASDCEEIMKKAEEFLRMEQLLSV